MKKEKVGVFRVIDAKESSEIMLNSEDLQYSHMNF